MGKLQPQLVVARYKVLKPVYGVFFPGKLFISGTLLNRCQCKRDDAQKHQNERVQQQRPKMQIKVRLYTFVQNMNELMDITVH